MADYRNRIIGLEYVNSRDLTAHPGNWRDHPKPQVDALRGVLAEVGIAGALLAYHSARAGGKLVTIDGHLRKDAAPQEWPVLVLDVTDAEADYILATHDPLSAMAQADAAALDALLESVNSGEAAVQEMLAGLADSVSLPGNGEWGDAFGKLPNEDRAPFQQMTFTLHDTQAEQVKRAIAIASKTGDFADSPNANGNGNALSLICELYLTEHGDGRG